MSFLNTEMMLLAYECTHGERQTKYRELD